MNPEDIARWKKRSFTEQMANIGSEVYRAGNWKKKGNPELAQYAFERALELFDLSSEPRHRFEALKELRRTREYFCGLFLSDYNDKEFTSLNKYFYYFAAALKR